jgi:Na+-translocating ferredoxin:NAD+ oxidoreductase RnfC subunit
MCEKVCPVGLLPQIMHRYIYRDALEEAKKMGIAACIDCRLCTYVCPSKIELADQFAKARAQIREEQI